MRIERIINSGSTSLQLDRLGLSSLPQLPVSLEVLDIRSNQLSTLQELPIFLQTLDARCNRLTALPELPRTLQMLFLRYNKLDRLPQLPAALLGLDVCYNQLTVLPTLPPGLERLYGSGNDLSRLPDLPAALKTLEICSNQLISLPVLPDALDTLDASSNLLTRLPDLSPSMRRLTISDNRLSSLPSLPLQLESLDACHNQLRTLPALPATLVTIAVKDNLLIELPALPPALAFLYASSNQLISLPALPPELSFLEASNNRLTWLPDLPQTWLTLAVANNQLTDLPMLPPDVRWLDAHDNQLPVTFYRRNCIDEARRWQAETPHLTAGNAALVAAPRATAAASERAQTAGNTATALPLLLPPLIESDTMTRRESAPAHWATGGQTRLPPLRLTQSSPGSPVSTRHQSSAASVRPRGSSPLATAHAAGARVAMRLGRVPGAPVFATGKFSGENALDFNRFLARLGETSDFANASSRARMGARVDRLVSGMRSAPALRDICFGIATQAIESCSDRIAQGLGDMERAKMNHDVEVQNYPIDELLSIGQEIFKLKVLDDIADDEIQAQRRSGEDMDEIEIRLAFHVGLHDRLDLPAVAQSMAYATTANLHPGALVQAEARVRNALAGSACVNFLVHWEPWQHALEHADTDGSYQRARVLHQRECDSLSIQPARVTEGEWLEELEGMQERHEADVCRIARRLTREVLVLEGETASV